MDQQNTSTMHQKQKRCEKLLTHSALKNEVCVLNRSSNLFLYTIILSLFFLSCNQSATESHTKISKPKAAKVAKHFENPPAEYSLTFYWGWDGDVTEDVIKHDLDEFKSNNVHVVTLEPGYNMPNAYLSDGWFEDVQKAVMLAKERGMKVYLVDEGKYPSGFAGGKIALETPELCMKILIPDSVIKVKDGEQISLSLSNEIVSAAAYNKASGETQELAVNNGVLNWTAPNGEWEIVLVKHVIRSSPTRSVNNLTGGKDSKHALIDYLDVDATNKFIEFTHDKYKDYLGEEFGKTILGFRGDEPDYSTRGIPWTPAIFEEFKKQKGYDVQPFVATFFAPTQTEEQKRIKADYWDVWSTLFADNFFQVQADWCAASNVDYLVHLNHEEHMTGLIRSEGCFFKTMRSVQMPGVDVIWHQIWPGEVNPVFPKYASSSAHINGRARSFTESFAAFRPQPNFDQAKWILNQQLVRGINMVEVMFVPASSKGQSGMRGWLAHEDFPQFAKYIHRSCYLLSQGIPAAKIAVLFPTTSVWLGHHEIDTLAINIMQQLLEAQHDFDVVDEGALDSIMIMKDGSFINKSRQAYSTIIVPPLYAISENVLSRLKEFETSGGTLISIGNDSILAVGKTFKEARKTKPEWKINEPYGNLTRKVLMALPESDFILDRPCKDIKYTHRKLKDADLYFIFNEGDENQKFEIELSGKGKVQVWDALQGEIRDVTSEQKAGDRVAIDLKLAAWETTFVVVGKK